MHTRNQYFLPCTVNGPLKSICHNSSGFLALKNFQRLCLRGYPFIPCLDRTLFTVSLDNHTPCTQGIDSRMKSGSLYKPCCMRAVPHPKVFLRERMDNSTSPVTLLAFGCLGLSLKDSLPTCFPRLSHLYTVCLVISNNCAIRVTVNPFLISFLKIPLISGDSRITSPRKQSWIPFQKSVTLET